MIDLRPHKAWALAFFTGAAALFYGTPALNHLQKTEEAHIVQLKQEKTARLHALSLLQEDASSAKDLEEDFDETRLEKALAPTDLQTAQTRIEALSGAGRFSSFTSHLSPPEPLPLNQRTPDTESMRRIQIELSGKAPTDIDVLRFLTRLQKILPGHLALRDLSLERTTKNAPSGLSDINLAFSAKIDWTCNAISQEGVSP